jgi:hypothetical protein
LVVLPSLQPVATSMAATAAVLENIR